MDELKLPFIEDGLLDYLQRLYPDKAPEVDETERQIWMNRGAVGVVRHLKLVYDQQRENLLGGADVFRE